MIQFVIFDFDGVFTDGNIFFDNSNNILKYYKVKDGKAIGLLKDAGMKVGLISSFKTDKQILLNEKSVMSNMNSHLKFDYYIFGCKNKLSKLDEWLKTENLLYKNVAYIGDDLADIPVLKKVGYSACPSDAVDECEYVVDYVCKKKGGNGCVREFVNRILENKTTPNIICEIKKEVNYQIDNYNIFDVEEVEKIIRKCKGNIYISGVGKSGNIAKHCADLLKSVNLNVFYLNPMNILHGDIGVIGCEDVMVLFSKSGNTSELINIVPFVKQRNCYTVGVCCNADSKFKNMCDLTIVTPFKSEISGEINKIPTNSYMSHLLFSNMLVSVLKKNITVDDYKENHPAGNIGRNLKKIKECLVHEYPKIKMRNNILLRDILLEMTKYKIGCCFFINNKNKLIGILTDGDVRRILIKDNKKMLININDINKNYYYETDINKYIFECKKINFIPVLNSDKQLISIIHYLNN